MEPYEMNVLRRARETDEAKAFVTSICNSRAPDFTFREGEATVVESKDEDGCDMASVTIAPDTRFRYVTMTESQNYVGCNLASMTFTGYVGKRAEDGAVTHVYDPKSGIIVQIARNP